MASSVFIWPGLFTNNGTSINPLLPIAFQDGTVAIPSITFASELGLGFYRAGSGLIDFVTTAYSASVPMLRMSGGAGLLMGSGVGIGYASSGGASGTMTTYMRSVGAGLFNISSSTAETSGVGLDLGTDAVLKLRTRAQSAYATMDALGYKVSGNAFASATVAPASPTGTTSTTLVMAGLAGSITTQSGKILLTMSGYLTDNTANDGTKCQMSYGTGTAPINGAALTGTQVGPIVQYNASTLAAGASAPYAATWIVTGLTVNTAYWFDTAFAAITGGTGAIVQASMTACDIP